MTPVRNLFFLLVVPAFFTTTLCAQTREPVDTAEVSRLRKEERENSQVMNILSMLTDVSGPRLTNSAGFFRAAEYAKRQMEEWGLSSAHIDTWDETFGRGWNVERFSLEMVAPYYQPLVACPKGWSHGIATPTEAEAVYLDIKSEEDLKNYKGRLKGKIVLFSLPGISKLSFKANASRLTDSTLLLLANAAPGEAYSGRRFPALGEPQRLAYLKHKLCQDEGALATLEASPRMQDGVVMVNATTIPYPIDVPFQDRLPAYHSAAPKTLPQVVVSVEHYNRILRQLGEGVTTKLRLTLNVSFTAPQPGVNVIAEIPGSDLKEEVVMLGAHLDSWHAATGTTDNASGAAVMMEAMRLIKQSGLQPRRTIRIALWGGEEQGLLGSRNYVKRQIAQALPSPNVNDSTKTRSSLNRISVYFNSDLGSGKFRGVYLQGNENVRSIFRQWIKPFEKAGTATLTAKNITGTDHLTFDAVGIPAFQFIQDPLEYGTTTYHSNMDVFEKASEADLRHNSLVAAAFAWFAATRDERIPNR